MATSPLTPIRRWLGLASLVLATTGVVHAQVQNYYTWTGVDSALFNDADNWWRTAPIPQQIGVPLLTNDNVHLNFGDAPLYVLSNDLVNLRYRTWTFTNEVAGAYSISGNAIQVRDEGVLRNYNTYTHTIANDLAFQGGSLRFHIADGGVIWTGNSSSASQRNVFVSGLGTLDLRGNYTSGIGTLVLQGGTTILNTTSVFTSTTNITFNPINGGPNVTLMNNPAVNGDHIRGGHPVLQIHGSRTLGTFTSSLASLNIGGVIDVVLSAGTAVTFSSIVGSSDGQNISRFDLTAAGSSVSSATMPTLYNGVMRNFLVTSLRGGEVRTGFATVDSGSLARYDSFTAFPDRARRAGWGGVGTDLVGTANYSISGDKLLVTPTSGAYGFSSLTIQGPGSLSQEGPYTGTPTIGVGSGSRSILMEEGFVGDFHINVAWAVGGEQHYVYNYNTSGILYFNAGINRSTASTQQRLTKAGPGTVVIQGGADPNGGILGNLVIAEGRLEVNGAGVLGRMGAGGGAIHVSDTGIFGGSAIIGTYPIQYNELLQPIITGENAGYNPNSASNFASIRVYSGGTLDGSTDGGKDALYIAGDIRLLEQSNYHVTLGETRGTALHIARTPNPNAGISSTILTIINSNLSLELTYAPEIAEKILLLTWDSAYLRSGQFLTVNGGSFWGDNNDHFDLNLDGYGSVTFQLVYDDAQGEIYLNTIAIPEPTTIALLAGLALAGAVIYRRRKSAVA